MEAQRYRTRILAIVDDPTTPHGRRMARTLCSTTPVIWIGPSQHLASQLLSTDADVVALPLRVRGGHRGDRFTQDLIEALTWLRSRGCLVYVAQGPHPNALADVGEAVGARTHGIYNSASEACVATAEGAALSPCQFAGVLNG